MEIKKTIVAVVGYGAGMSAVELAKLASQYGSVPVVQSAPIKKAYQKRKEDHRGQRIDIKI